MFKRILVPLDGTARAERALPVAARLARLPGGMLILVEISNTHLEYGPYLDPGAGFAPLAIDRDDREIANYLRTVARSQLLTDIPSETVVASGPVATTILGVARTHAADLIVMAGHGRTGLARVILGSMTQKVARHATMPVLALADAGPSPADVTLGVERPLRILVPLDGSPLAEAALAPTLQLARSLVPPSGVQIHLLHVVDRMVSHQELAWGGPSVFLDDMAAFTAHTGYDDARAYLAGVATTLGNQMSDYAGIQFTTAVVADSDTARAIIETSTGTHERHTVSGPGPFDLIAMATHGRGGLERWALGSVMERVLQATQLPLFIVHAAQPATQQQRSPDELSASVPPQA